METSRNRLLASLAPPDLTLLARHLKRTSLDHGAVLQEQGARVDSVYFPLSGAVSLLVVMQSGEAVEATIVGPEGAVGLFADFGPWQACTRATVQASGMAESIPAPLFEIVAGNNEHIWHLMLRYKQTLSAQAQQSVACNALHSVEERVARWLLQLADRIENSELPVTQDALSQMLGVRRTTVTLIAQKLQHDGVIRYRRGRIIITDRAALQALSCECYTACRRRMDALLEDTHLARTPA